MQVDGRVDMGCRSIPVGIVTVCSLDDQGVGVQFLAEARDVSFVKCPDLLGG